jgi:signal transduction histidine kinase
VKSDSLGLVGMRERAELHDGRLTVETSTGGTTLAVELPL